LEKIEKKEKEERARRGDKITTNKKLPNLILNETFILKKYKAIKLKKRREMNFSV